jgi:AhpC/TSA family
MFTGKSYSRLAMAAMAWMMLVGSITQINGAFAFAKASDTPEPAPITRQKLDFYDFTLKTASGQSFNLREYAADKRVTIVAFVAGWCPNSNENGHVVKRLYDKYGERGLGVVVVTEYSDAEEVRIHVNRIGINYPVVTETRGRKNRKDSLHYKYRRAVGDKRKWGTPFYVIIPAPDIEPAQAKAPLARQVFTVSGEIIEAEAERFIEQQISQSARAAH